MELVSVDPIAGATKNSPVTPEQRKRIGARLRAMRIERGLRQSDVANTRGLGISLGTLQAIERARYEVRDTNIEAYAQFFGTTITKLLKADEKTITATDPRLVDLNDEHLDIARQSMRARKRPRAGVELLLSHPSADQFAALLLTLSALPDDRLTELATLLATAPDEHPPSRLWDRFQRLSEHRRTTLMQVIATQEQAQAEEERTTAEKRSRTKLVPTDQGVSRRGGFGSHETRAEISASPGRRFCRSSYHDRPRALRRKGRAARRKRP